MRAVASGCVVWLNALTAVWGRPDSRVSQLTDLVREEDRGIVLHQMSSAGAEFEPRSGDQLRHAKAAFGGHSTGSRSPQRIWTGMPSPGSRAGSPAGRTSSKSAIW